MNKKVILGTFLLLIEIFYSIKMFQINALKSPFLSWIPFIVGLTGMLLLLKGIANTKKILKIYRYNGELGILNSIVEKSINQLNLITNKKSINDKSFYFSLSERIRLISLFLPIHFELKAIKSGKIIELNIQTSYKLWSLIKTKHMQKKAQELLDIVKKNLPKLEDIHEIDALNMRFIKDKITKKEYEGMIKNNEIINEFVD